VKTIKAVMTVLMEKELKERTVLPLALLPVLLLLVILMAHPVLKLPQKLLVSGVPFSPPLGNSFSVNKVL
jgi:hypothetical protein